MQLVVDSNVFGTYGSIAYMRNSLAGLLSGIEGGLGAYRDAPAPASPGVGERVR